MFPSTLPMDASDGRPPPPPPAAVAVPEMTTLSSLSPSLLQDLMRFDADGPQRELLEVLAACVRHTQPLAITLKLSGQRQLVLSVFPLDRLVHSPVPIGELLANDLATPRVLQVAPARWRAPGTEGGLVDLPERYSPLGPVLWAVALYGGRDALLPELAGQAAYRVSPGASLGGLAVPGALASAITRLRRQTSNLREITSWPGINADRATRLLNALYLQSALIVSRTHPAATNEGWTGYGPG